MALNITSQVITSEGIQVPTSYARISVRDDKNGDQLVVGISFYATEAAWAAGSNSFSIKNPSEPQSGLPFQEWSATPYNRATDGTDILSLAHDFAQSRLNAIGVTSQIVL